MLWGAWTIGGLGREEFASTKDAKPSCPLGW